MMDDVTLRAHAAACEAYALPEPLSDDPNRVEQVYVQREAYEAGYLKALDGMERIEDAGGWMRGVWERSLEHYGVRDRMIVCMEECSELIHAVSKLLRGRDVRENLVEEMADVTICFNLLAIIHDVNPEQLDKVIRAKTIREARQRAAGTSTTRNTARGRRSKAGFATPRSTTCFMTCSALPCGAVVPADWPKRSTCGRPETSARMPTGRES